MEKVIKENIALIGTMKIVNNQIAKILADDLDMTYVDTDSFIEYQEGISCGKIVAEHGEKYFYKVEAGKIAELGTYYSAMIGTSGSFLMNYAENLKSLQENCYIVLLTADKNTQKKRIQKDKSLAVRDDLLKNLDFLNTAIDEEIKRQVDLVVDTTKLAPVQAAKEIRKELARILKGEIKK